MAFHLDSVVPWGRSFDEYVRMFALSEADLAGRILGCGDGPASFNAEASRRGHRIVSCDPIYQYSVDEIRDRIDATFDEILEQARANESEFIWTTIASVEALGQVRRSAMEEFMDDFGLGLEEGRYVRASLPDLLFNDGEFDLALCSHFLFLYADHLTESFHLDAIREMTRVALEVRIFPLLALGSRPSPYVRTVAEHLRTEGYNVDIEAVDYEFQRGGNEMMRIRRS